jgi:S1-C subfamily serine protease
MGYIEDDSFSVLSIAAVKGNSGSPVQNFEGKVIGILTEKASLDNGATDEWGVALALSMHKVKDWIEKTLRSDGYFEKLE